MAFSLERPFPLLHSSFLTSWSPTWKDLTYVFILYPTLFSSGSFRVSGFMLWSLSNFELICVQLKGSKFTLPSTCSYPVFPVPFAQQAASYPVCTFGFLQKSSSSSRWVFWLLYSTPRIYVSVSRLHRAVLYYDYVRYGNTSSTILIAQNCICYDLVSIYIFGPCLLSLWKWSCNVD